MPYSIIIREKAEKQIHQIYEWYEEKREFLGDDFLVEIENSVKILELNPEAFQVKFKSIRVIYTKHFPFGIFYSIEKQKVIIFAIFHVSQNPNLWKKIY